MAAFFRNTRQQPRKRPGWLFVKCNLLNVAGGKEKNKHANKHIEGAQGHFRRMVLGTYHFISKKHLQAYIDEAAYRWNTRMVEAQILFADLFALSIGIVRYEAITSKQGCNIAEVA